jgi:hypothetical protein
MAVATAQSDKVNSETPPQGNQLEVAVTQPLRWEKDCLRVDIERANRSSDTLFLPDLGLVIGLSVRSSGPPSGLNPETSWIPAYGVSDIPSFEATPLGSGGVKSDGICIRPSIAVSNIKKETRREVAVRGSLQIYAYYFPTKQDWLTSKSQHKEMLRTPPDEWTKPLNPLATTTTVKIPCRESYCDPACDEPPIIFEGEAPLIPDAMNLDKEWNERGRVINAELAQKYSPCPAP